MNVLEKILEEIERTRKSIIDMSDEEPELVDVEDWFDEGVDQGKLIAYEVAKEIIRSHMDEKKKVLSAEIIRCFIDKKPYYAIKYKEIGKDDYTIGYGSYNLVYVIDWLNECFEFCGKAKGSVNIGKDTNVPSNDGWIPVEERLPSEKGWYQCTCSDKNIWNKDIVRNLHYYPETKEFVDNIRYENNGLKNIENYYWTKYVIAWQPLPEPYKPKEKVKKRKNTQQEMEDFWNDK